MSATVSAATVLELVGVSRIHGSGAAAVCALDNIDLTVCAGELVAVMGPSGSGKSTLLNLAGGLDSPTSGSVVVSGAPLGDLGRKRLAALRRQRVGYVFQSLNLLPSLTALENVMLPRELDGVPTRRARREATRALDEVGLLNLSTRFPDDMSGGQQQRVAIARAVVGERTLILADEPTGALDSQTGEDVLRLLRSRCDAGAAGVLVTHDARHAAWADRVVFLRDGSVADSDPAARPARVPPRPMNLASWRAALRIARREAWRGKLRSILVVALIGVPVLILTAVDVLYQTYTIGPAEQVSRTLGAADARIDWIGTGVVQVDPNGSGYTFSGGAGSDSARPADHGRTARAPARGEPGDRVPRLRPERCVLHARRALGRDPGRARLPRPDGRRHRASGCRPGTTAAGRGRDLAHRRGTTPGSGSATSCGRPRPPTPTASSASSPSATGTTRRSCTRCRPQCRRRAPTPVPHRR